MALIHERMAAVMAETGSISKGRRNTAQGYQFRGVDDVYAAMHDLMAKHRVYTLPTVTAERSEERQTAKGSTLIYRVLTIKYTFYTDDGSSVECTVIGEGMDSGDKASNKAMSVAHKYALLQAWCIPTEEPKDPENESHDIAPKQVNKSNTNDFDF